MRIMHWSVTAAALLGSAACADLGTSPGAVAGRDLTAAFTAAPVATADLNSSYVGGGAMQAGDSTGWMGHGRDAHGPGAGGMMGGGLGAEFVGGIGFTGMGGHRGPFGAPACAGTFNAATGRVECASVTLRNGLTVAKSIAYANAAGAVQQAFDSATTNMVNVKVAVRGTVTLTPDSARRQGGHGGGGMARGGMGREGGHGFGRLFGDTASIVSASTTVQNASDRTVTGLAAGSTQRTVNGTSAGRETTTGTSSRGAFTVVRVAGDTTTAVIVPVSTTAPTYPTAGTVVRSMTVTLTHAGSATQEVSRREVVTYDGTATAKITITENGVTKRCTRALPRGTLTCQ
ncbi:MAG: hypothetical protein ACYC3Q_10830 [Gemmatimonadaceae bacterium]